MLAYLEENNPALLPLLRGLRTYSTDAYMVLDAHTRRNLELTRGARGGAVEGSLLAVLDATRTPMGGRLLRRYLGQPLLDLAAIAARQAAVAAFVERRPLRADLVGRLNGLGDLERLTSRALQGVAGARDLLALRALLLAVGPLRDQLLAAMAPVPAAGGIGHGGLHLPGCLLMLYRRPPKLETRACPPLRGPRPLCGRGGGDRARRGRRRRRPPHP